MASSPPQVKNQRLVLYAMPDRQNPKDGHPFLVGRRSSKNDKKRYILDEQFMAVGLFWPNTFVKNRDELALAVGKSILDELGV